MFIKASTIVKAKAIRGKKPIIKPKTITQIYIVAIMHGILL